RDDYNVVDHYSYALVSDGDLMEGISHEAASLAGHLGLGKLIALYDSNDISLDGVLNKSFSDKTQKRFESYNWQVLRVEDGNNVDELINAIKEAQANTEQPTLIEVKTVIGFGSQNKAGSNTSHGAPLGADEVLLTKEAYKWEHDEFHVPDEVYRDFEEKIVNRGQEAEDKWNQMFAEYKKAYPELAEEFELAQKGE